MDKSVTEKEVVYVPYFDPHSKSNPDEVEVKLSFLWLKDIIIIIITNLLRHIYIVALHP